MKELLSTFSQQGWQRSITKVNYRGEDGGERRWVGVGGQYTDSTPHRRLRKESAQLFWIWNSAYNYSLVCT